MIIGIDLGTTNSLASVWRDGEAVLIPNALGHVLTPSAVGLADDGRLLVGLPARERLVSHPALTTAAFKRRMGTDQAVPLGRRSFRPEELSALVLQSLKADAEAFLGEPIGQAVITVPAYFNEAQRRATQLAGELAGLDVVRLLSEPTAAALAYGLQEARAGEGTILVFDLGGGTFDVSILEFFDGVMEVRAAAGDAFLGGEDFVDAIVGAFHADASASAGFPARSTPHAAHALLRRQAEVAKRRLSEAEDAVLEFPLEDRTIRWPLSRQAFEAASEPLLARLRGPIERALRDARLRPEALSQVVLVGGATRMPMIRRLVSMLFRRLPLQRLNPDEVVARGAAVQAGLKMRDAALDEIVMTDVTPFTLGVDIAVSVQDQHVEGHYLPIIERNTVVPVSRVKRVQTLADNQRRLRVRVFQGEARLVADNIALGELMITVPPAPAGQEQVDIRFSYDSSGLLEVQATVVSTGREERLVIEGQAARLSRQEIEAKLRAFQAIKVHPRDMAENTAVMARGDRLFQERLGAERETIGLWLAAFSAVLDRQDPREIALARQQLTELLDSVDRGVFL
ncbi:molecular chaperone HscC [Inquilinus limosus]|uniref:Hsp70 family protein n=1 Tax=Inquilinus limosus TaxID=171674 RepID=UPI003F15B171